MRGYDWLGLPLAPVHEDLREGQLLPLLRSAALRAPVTDEEPRRVPRTGDRQKVREIQRREAAMAMPGQRVRTVFFEHYDWALVWRYWHGQAEGLRGPYALEILELLRLGRHLSDERLAERLGMSYRTVSRWRSRFA